MDVCAQVRSFIIDNLMVGQDGDRLTDSASLLEMGVLDSVGVLELVDFLEGAFQISVEDEDLVPENLDSVDNLVAYIKKRVP